MSQNDNPIPNTVQNEDINNESQADAVSDENLEYEAFSEELAPTGQPEQNTDHIAQTAEQNADAIRIKALEDELSRTKDQMVRALAEAENTRRRAQKDREDASKFAVTSFSRDILSVADNLRRALDAMPQEILENTPQVKNLTDGIEATERELLRAFEKNGIKKISPIDQPFDPNFHEVMFEAPIPDKPTGTVIQVLEDGYTINGRILRPARVGISKGGQEAPQNINTEPGQNVNTEA